MAPTLAKKVGLDLNYLDVHLNTLPDLRPLDTYLGRLAKTDYSQATRDWLTTFPQGMGPRFGLTSLKDPLTAEILSQHYGHASLIYKGPGCRVAWIFADPKDIHIVALDWGIFRPQLTVFVKAPSFPTGLSLVQQILPRQNPPNLPKP